MFITDKKTDFYQLIKRECARLHSRVLIFVAYDVDAIAACRIVQFLFEADNIQYSIVPISSSDELIKAYREHADRVKLVLLLNIGATFDVDEVLKVNDRDDVTIFVADSHRPIDVGNVYVERVRLVTFEEDEEDRSEVPIPSYEQVFGRPTPEEQDIMDKDERERTGEEWEALNDFKRWCKERKRIDHEYNLHSFYLYSTALTMYDLAWKLSKDNNQLLWLAIIGVADQFINGKISQQKYATQCLYLKNAANRLKNIRGDRRVLAVHEDEQTGIPTQNNYLNITYEKDLKLVLYRHWSLYESLRHTSEVACQFKIWKLRGHKHLLNFLAKVGLPLAQCRQKFSSMDLDLRNNVRQWIEEHAHEFRLTKSNSIIGHFFVASRGFKDKFTCNDVALATRALLESPEKDKRKNLKFFDAIDSLSWNNLELLESGLELAKIQLMAILKQVQIMVDSKQIALMNSHFFHVTIHESVPDAKLFCYPGCLTMLAKFLLHAHASANPKSRKCFELPLILLVPNVNKPGMGMAVAVPPAAANDPKNFFSQAFRQLEHSQSHQLDLEIDLLDPCVIHFPFNERAELLNRLSSHLN